MPAGPWPTPKKHWSGWLLVTSAAASTVLSRSRPPAWRWPRKRGTARAAPPRPEWAVPAGVGDARTLGAGGARTPRGAVHQPRGAAIPPPGTQADLPPGRIADQAPRRHGHRLATYQDDCTAAPLHLQHMPAMCSPRAEHVCGMWRQVTAFYICPPHQLHGRCTESGLPGPVALVRAPDERTRAARPRDVGENMTAITQDRLAVQTHRIFVRATAEEVWDALTRPGWTQKYGFRAAVH